MDDVKSKMKIGGRFQLTDYPRSWSGRGQSGIERAIYLIEITEMDDANARYRVIQTISRIDPCPNASPVTSGGFALTSDNLARLAKVN